MSPDQRPNLSLCMIVKDEAARLARCLASAQPWVRQMVVVDTGSSDHTVSVAQGFGAQVYHQEWRGDFAYHRNHSLDQASGDWILLLDADEELEPASAPALRAVAQDTVHDCAFVEIVHLAPGGRYSLQVTPKLIRRAAGLRFQGRIHEHLVGGSGKGLRAPVRIIHHGFALPDPEMQAKARRNLALLRQWVREEPQSFAARCYLAQTLQPDPEKAEQALSHAVHALALAQQQGLPASYLARAYHPLLMALTMMERPEEVAQRAEECLAILPDYPDPLFSLAWAQRRRGRWEEVCRTGRRFASLQERWATHSVDYPYSHNASLAERPKVLGWWLEAAARLGWWQEALEVADRLLGLAGGRQVVMNQAGELRALAPPPVWAELEAALKERPTS